jgi:hypothetical protein
MLFNFNWIPYEKFISYLGCYLGYFINDSNMMTQSCFHAPVIRDVAYAKGVHMM